MLVGYIFAGAEQASERSEQKHSLQRAGCRDIVEESASADRREQPDLHRLLNRLDRGDVVVTPSLGSLGSSLEDVVRLMDEIEAAGLGFRSLEEGIDTTNAAGRAAAPMIASLAAFGRDVARDRIGIGIGIGVATVPIRKRGGGRPSKLNSGEKLDVAWEVFSGRSTAADMARLHGVSEATISRLLAARRAGAAPEGTGQPGDADARRGGRVVGVLPLSALDGRFALVGTSGSGKTYAAKGLVERLMDGGGRVCVVDPLGVWWGLRAGADGAAPGYPVVVFGGRHADIPLDEGMGAAVGQLVGTRPLACVLDLSEYTSSAAQRLFMTAFAEALRAVNTEPLHEVAGFVETPFRFG